ncbi:hypothetical protein SEA_SIXAMA_45 [Gordonia phage Sixama]|uniref:Uncharacterized protein n=1 Tax=Gordonia phage Sixama TaxID=2653271 RepID=A0A5Q2F564_9CAUD|nr:hypothetical protein PP302_gp045 [Gordonia phage Sixama]QGF20224.1 hypothetical protein SEA_SIXAMA_45 [Gordonia phage Sixama]
MFNLFSWLSQNQKRSLYNSASESSRILNGLAMGIAEVAIVNAHNDNAAFVRCLLCPPEDVFIRDPSDLDAQKQIADHIAKNHQTALAQIIHDRVFGKED